MPYFVPTETLAFDRASSSWRWTRDMVYHVCGVVALDKMGCGGGGVPIVGFGGACDRNYSYVWMANLDIMGTLARALKAYRELSKRSAGC